MSAIGFIGTGTIGGPMAERLLDAGHAPRIFDVDPDAGAHCVAKGAERTASVQAIAIREDLIPFAERLVGSQEDRALLFIVA